MTSAWEHMRSSFVAVSRNPRKVLIADSTAVNYIDLASPLQINRLTFNTNVRSTSCAIAGNGQRAITTHYPAQVHFWRTHAGQDESFVQPTVALEGVYPLASMCWMNADGTQAIAIFGTDMWSYLFRFEWDETNIEARCEKMRNSIRGLAVSEPLGIAMLLEPNAADGYHRLTLQNLVDVGTYKLHSMFGFNDPDIPTRICIADLTGSAFVQVGDRIRIFNACVHDGERHYDSNPRRVLGLEGERLCDVSVDGERVLTCGTDMRFNVWYVPTRKSIVRCLGANNRNFVPILSPFGDEVLYVDHTNNLWCVSIEGRFISNLRNAAAVRPRWPERCSNHSNLTVPIYNTPSSRFVADVRTPVVNHQLLMRLETLSISGHLQTAPSPVAHRVTSEGNLSEAEVERMQAAVTAIRKVLQRACSAEGGSSPRTTMFPRSIGTRWMQRQEIEKQLNALDEMLDSKKVSDDDHICAIDREPFRKGEKVLCLPCDHMFHYDCMFTFLSNSETPKCPLCRHEVSKVFGLQHVAWVWKNDGSDAKMVWSETVGRWRPGV